MARCKKGQIRVRRKAYTRKDGTRVAATQFCETDRGLPGRGPKTLPSVTPGKLGGPGFTKKSTAARRRILRQCVRRDGYASCRGRLQWMLNIGANTMDPDTLAKLRSDREWLVATFGAKAKTKKNAKPKRRTRSGKPMTGRQILRASLREHMRAR